jgi:hypothetical protein
MIKLSNKEMCKAFAEVEYMDYLIVAALFSDSVDTSDLWWKLPDHGCRVSPAVAVNPDLNHWEQGLIMVLVGLRSDSTVSVRFRLNEDGSWECLVPKEDRDEICRRSMGQAAAKANLVGV